MRETLYKDCPCTVDFAGYTVDCTLSTVDYLCVKPHAGCSVNFLACAVDCDWCTVDCHHTVDCLYTVDWHYNFLDNAADTIYLTGTGLVLNNHTANNHTVNLHVLNIHEVKPHDVNIHI